MKKQIELYLFKSKVAGFTYVSLSDQSDAGDNLLAPSIPMEIDFNLYDEGVINEKEIEAIDAKIDKLREETLREIIKLSGRKKILMEINHVSLP